MRSKLNMPVMDRERSALLIVESEAGYPNAFDGGDLTSIAGRSASHRRRSKLLVEPDVFHPRPVERAVDHQRKVFDVRLPAGGAAVVEDDRTGTVCRHLSFDLPEDPAAMARDGGGDRLTID